MQEIVYLNKEEIFALIDKYNVNGPRYTSYPTVPIWNNNFPVDNYSTTLTKIKSGKKPVALYLHIPYCQQRCFYCGCNSFINDDVSVIDNYARSLCSEIKLVRELVGEDQPCSWVHLGGGTPTYLPADSLSRILDALFESFPKSDLSECSIEVDPRVTSLEHIKMLSEYGFTRVSIGLQDLEPAVQQAVNRVYSFEEIVAFVKMCRQSGFSGINIDLIYGLPLQTCKSWNKTIELVASIRPDRLAVFGYAHLPVRMEHQRSIRSEDLPSVRERLGMLLDANLILRSFGYTSIGLDHFALPEDKLAIASVEGRLSRNFMGYTDLLGLEMIGFGSSAIGEYNDMFVQNKTNPHDYTLAINEGLATNRGYILNQNDRIRKQIINDLMCNLMIRIPHEAKLLPNKQLSELNRIMESMDQFIIDGLLEPLGASYRITFTGKFFLRNLAMLFDRYLTTQTTKVFTQTI